VEQYLNFRFFENITGLQKKCTPVTNIGTSKLEAISWRQSRQILNMAAFSQSIIVFSDFIQLSQLSYNIKDF